MSGGLALMFCAGLMFGGVYWLSLDPDAPAHTPEPPPIDALTSASPQTTTSTTSTTTTSTSG